MPASLARLAPGAASCAMRPVYRTPRLVVRAWTPDDAPARKAAIDASLDRLQPWFPWAAADPRPLAAHEVLLARQAADFAAGVWWSYGMWLRGEPRADTLVGAAGVYRARQDAALPSVREFSYWVASGHAGRGYAAEALGALADGALAEPGVLTLEVRVDPANAASARVPPRVGFTLRERLVGDREGPRGEPLDTLVWERRAHPARLRAAVAADVPRLQEIRAAVRENWLGRPDVVPTADYHATIERGLCWVWADDGRVQGFASGHPSGSNEVWALFVDPAAEGRGVGSALLAQVTDVLWRLGHRDLVLGTQPGSRAERVYRAAGWTAVGHAPNGDVRMVRDL